MSPPFSSKEKKKHEFPDAIALLALEKWAISNNTKILAVSMDNDWDNFIKLSSVLLLEKDLSNALGSIQPILNQAVAIDKIKIDLMDPTSPLNNRIEELLSDSIFNYNIEVTAYSDFRYDYEIADGQLMDFILQKDNNGEPIINVIEISDDQISMEFKVEYNFQVNLNFDFFVYDAIDREDSCIGNSEQKREFRYESGIVASGKIEKTEDIPIFVLEKVELSNEISHIDFGYVNPYDGEFDDEFYN